MTSTNDRNKVDRVYSINLGKKSRALWEIQYIAITRA